MNELLSLAHFEPMQTASGSPCRDSGLVQHQITLRSRSATPEGEASRMNRQSDCSWYGLFPTAVPNSYRLLGIGDRINRAGIRTLEAAARYAPTHHLALRDPR